MSGAKPYSPYMLPWYWKRQWYICHYCCSFWTWIFLIYTWELPLWKVFIDRVKKLAKPRPNGVST